MTECEILNYITEYGIKAKKASSVLATASIGAKNAALANAAELLVQKTDYIISENAKDLEAAASNGMSVPMQDRLRLTPERIKDMAEGLTQLISLEDPIGAIIEGYRRPNGLEIIKKRVPFFLEIVGLSHKSDSFPTELSGGEKQRVAFARALVNNPDTIIADEPTGNVDIQMSEGIMELLMKIWDFRQLLRLRHTEMLL